MTSPALADTSAGLFISRPSRGFEMTDIVSSTVAERQSEKRPLRNSRATDDDGRELRKERAIYFSAVLGSSLPDGEKLVLTALLRRAGRGGGPRWEVAVTERDLAGDLGKPLETMSWSRKALVKRGLITPRKVPANGRLPDGEISVYGTNVYTLDPEKILALAPVHAREAVPPCTNVVRPELARVEREFAEALAARDATHARELAAERATRARERAEDRAAFERARAEDRAAFAAMFATMTSAPPAPPVDTPAQAGSSSGQVPGGPVGKSPKEQAVDSARSPGRVNGRVGVRIDVDPSSLDQGLYLSPASALSTTPHTQRASARATAIPPAPIPSVRANDVHESKPKKPQPMGELEMRIVLAYLGKRWQGIDVTRWAQDEWDTTNYASPGKLAAMKKFVREHPWVTVRDCIDAIEGGWLKPSSFDKARYQSVIFSDEYFEPFCADGRKPREARERREAWERTRARERERGKEQEQNEIHETAAAAVVSLPSHAPTWLREAAEKLAGVAS
jgi:hypothetical protein